MPLALLFFLILSGLCSPALSVTGGRSDSRSLIQIPANSNFTKEMYAFWSEFQTALLAVAPSEHELRRVSDFKPESLYSGKNDYPRPDLMEPTWNQFKQLRKQHDVIVENISQLAHKLPYKKGATGIVMTCSKDALSYMLISLKMLRRTNSTLPLELFLPSPEDYRYDVCEEILPKLNAKCIMMEEIIKNISISRFQYKVFAMLYSSFENMFFLDADNIAIHNPDELIFSRPYLDDGMIIWLDFWAESISPAYYDLISRPIPPNLTHSSCEAGQLLLSKPKHANTLLLSVYYNLYGYGHYYRLMSQNGHGEGDKETFYVAADFYNQSYYRVKTNVEQLNFYKTGTKDFLAMVQPHPIDDWKRYIQNDTSQEVRWLFIHANFPKVKIHELMRPNSLAIAENGTMRRIWASKEVMHKHVGYDIEERLWQVIKEVAPLFYPDLAPMVDQYYRVVIEKSEPQPQVHKGHNESEFNKSYIILAIVAISLLIGVLVYQNGGSKNATKSI